MVFDFTKSFEYISLLVLLIVCGIYQLLTFMFISSASGDFKILTKGDNNYGDDRLGQIYAPRQNWVTKDEVIGRARG